MVDAGFPSITGDQLLTLFKPQLLISKEGTIEPPLWVVMRLAQSDLTGVHVKWDLLSLPVGACKSTVNTNIKTLENYVKPEYYSALIYSKLLSIKQGSLLLSRQEPLTYPRIFQKPFPSKG